MKKSKPIDDETLEALSQWVIKNMAPIWDKKRGRFFDDQLHEEYTEWLASGGADKYQQYWNKQK